MIKKIELLSPAGNIEKGKLALDFGADAIYFGAKSYSLRARASNYTFEHIEEISKYAHDKNKKIFLVTNILCQNVVINGFKTFFNCVNKYKPDAYICADPYIINTIRELDKNVEIHISTQQSVSNSKAALFFARNNCNRVILSREVSGIELKELIKNVDKKIEIEYFIHGAVCIAYSGRCMLSNICCLRDANVGGCAQSCRWIYKLYDGNKKISHFFTMSAKDMCLIKKIPELIKTGLTSMKIEGRMKSEYYIANVVNDYRKTIDNYYSKKTNESKINILDINKVANRETELAWYDGNANIKKMLYHEVQKPVTQNFAFLIKKIISNNEFEIITKNNIKLKNKFEIICQKDNTINKITILKMKNMNNENVDIVQTPMTPIIVTIKENLSKISVNDIGRIKN